MSWFNDFRYGAARRRLFWTLSLAVLVLAGLTYVLLKRMESVRHLSAPSFAAEPHIQPLDVSAPAASAVSTEESHGDNGYERAAAALQNNDAAGALALVTQTLEKGEVSAAAWNLQAACLALLHRITDAETAMDKAIALEPDNPQYLFNQAIIKQRLGKFDQALQLLKKIGKGGADEDLIEIKILLVRIQNGEGEAVRRQIDAAAEIAPLALGIRCLIGRAALALAKGNDPLAAEELQKVRKQTDAATFRSLIADPYFEPYQSHPLITPFFLANTQ